MLVHAHAIPTKGIGVFDLVQIAIVELVTDLRVVIAVR
jgi:hypothetical protein